MPYKSGLARGDTPPHEIPSIGAAPRRPLSFQLKHDPERSDWIIHRDDESGRFAQRTDTMSMDVVQPSDTLRGCPKNYKDYDPSLTTEDIHRAQPCIAHPCTNGHHTVPFKHMQKLPTQQIERNRAATNYPPIAEFRRTRDMSLTTGDVEKATAVTNGLKTRRVVNPVTPHYTLSASEAKPSTPPKSGRDHISIYDIEKSSPAKLIPVRNEYRDTMMVEDEFKAQKKKAHGLTMSLKAHDIMGHVPPRSTGPQKSFRCSDPLNPTYTVPLAADPSGATSLYSTWDEERSAGKGAPKSVTGTIGEIEGSKPKVRTRDNGEPFLSLLREDLPTACPMRRIGAMPYSMYGPPGNRRFSASLDTADIQGAQADTLPRGPRMPVRPAREGNASEPGYM